MNAKSKKNGPNASDGRKTDSEGPKPIWVPHSSRHRVTHHMAAQVSGDAKGGELLLFAWTIRSPPFAYGEEWGTRRSVTHPLRKAYSVHGCGQAFASPFPTRSTSLTKKSMSLSCVRKLTMHTRSENRPSSVVGDMKMWPSVTI